MRVIPRGPLERTNFATPGKPHLAQGKNDHPDGLRESRNNSRRSFDLCIGPVGRN
jgi:hypothetical protein